MAMPEKRIDLLIERSEPSIECEWCNQDRKAAYYIILDGYATWACKGHLGKALKRALKPHLKGLAPWE